MAWLIFSCRPLDMCHFRNCIWFIFRIFKFQPDVASPTTFSRCPLSKMLFDTCSKTLCGFHRWSLCALSLASISASSNGDMLRSFTYFHACLSWKKLMSQSVMSIET
ncbi:hypothetical protein CCHR01_08311 [Colletotrichum chrysophilum]|uniref:Uncharacterized protein n=1 Tax=Colletotrichum chrysophilum TaxID=1836956 RepID=A0AAD9EHU9_9PEZI|nr:hypothetical protein CCHR01_08311 [Colletotrichum chrysophilum]